MIGGFRSVLFFCFCFKIRLCDRPISGKNHFVVCFAYFSDLSYSCNICLLPSTKPPHTIAISFAILEQSTLAETGIILIFVLAGRAPLDFHSSHSPHPYSNDWSGTEKPKISSKFAKGAAWFNENCKWRSRYWYGSYNWKIAPGFRGKFSKWPLILHFDFELAIYTNVTRQHTRFRCNSLRYSKIPKSESISVGAGTYLFFSFSVQSIYFLNWLE